MKAKRSRRIILTGATGFLGRRLAVLLAAAGYQVVGVTRDASSLRCQGIPVQEWISWSAQLPNRLVPDVLIHTSTEYGHNGTSAAEINVANVEQPLGLWQQCAHHGARLIAADTFFCKADGAYAHLSLYAQSKAQFAIEATRIAHASHVPATFALIEHMYGPGDSPAKAIPGLVRQIVHSTERIALTDGGQRRDFIHVDDVARAFATILAAAAAPGTSVVGVGTGQATSMKELLLLIHARAGSAAVLGFGDLPRRAGEFECSVADTTALGLLGWKAAVTLVHGVDELIAEARRP